MYRLKVLYGYFLMTTSRIFGVDFAKTFDSALRFKRKLNLKNPMTLADKVSYIELHKQSPLAAACTDKYQVREYVAKKGYEHILIPMAGGPWNQIEEIDFEELPESFVFKATHGCKMNYIVTDKCNFDKSEAIEKMKKWISTTYGRYSMEPHYEQIPHRIYAEKYIGDMDELIDYKIHCFNGRPKFILTCRERNVQSNRNKKVILDIFDVNWNPVFEIREWGAQQGDGNVARPKALKEMLKIAAELSKDFIFVRVDLYEQNGRIYFGELTFTPSCCVFPNFSERFIEKMGHELIID